MASWNIPALVNKIAEDIPAIKGLLTALFKWTDADTTDVPTGAKRLQSVTGGRQIQEYSGSAWASVGKLMHDCDMLDGKHASTSQTANTIPVRDANGTIPGNISGNAATATEASSLASGYTVPIANGGTGATTAANARSALGANNASNISSGILGVAYGGTGSSTKNFVDLTNNQNVGGTKTFSTSFTTSTSPMLTSTNWSGIGIGDTTRGQASYKMLSQVLDKDGKRFVGIEAVAATDGTRSVYLTMRKNDDSGYASTFSFKLLANGTIQSLVNTPPADANDTQCATTAWVRTWCDTTKKYLTSHQSLANYLTKTTNVSEMGRYIDMHYDNATSKYDYDVRFQINSQGTAAGGGVLQIVAASVKASKFEGPLTGNVTGNCSGSSGSCTGNAATATTASSCSGNAATATTLKTARKINGVSFNGSADITIADSTKVAKSGDTMTGQLKMTRANGSAGGGIRLEANGQNYAISIMDTGATKGTAPSGVRYSGIDFYGKTYSSYKNRLGLLQCTYNTDKSTCVGIYAYKAVAAEDTGTCSIECHVDKSGNGYTCAPTPAAGDNSTKIATTAWVRGRLHISTGNPSGGTDGDVWFKYS